MSLSVLWDGVVLAGGRSSRMGQDKALLPWHGVPLYQYMGTILAQANAAEVMVSRRNDGSPQGQTWLQDIVPDRGPMSGIHGALVASKAEALVIVPVDMPLLTSTHIMTLVDHFDGRHGVEFYDYSLPLLLPVNRQVISAVEESIYSTNPKHYALWRLREKLGTRQLPVPDDHQQAFANTNTPTEWQAASAHQWSVGSEQNVGSAAVGAGVTLSSVMA